MRKRWKDKLKSFHQVTNIAQQQEQDDNKVLRDGEQRDREKDEKSGGVGLRTVT